MTLQTKIAVRAVNKERVGRDIATAGGRRETVAKEAAIRVGIANAVRAATTDIADIGNDTVDKLVILTWRLGSIEVGRANEIAVDELVRAKERRRSVADI